MKIALFITCLADAMFPEVGKATVRVLERLGQVVEFPAEQTCCGQMHVNTGVKSRHCRLSSDLSRSSAPTTRSWRRRAPVSARCVISIP